jgi:hypothetical protein
MLFISFYGNSVWVIVGSCLASMKKIQIGSIFIDFSSHNIPTCRVKCNKQYIVFLKSFDREECAHCVYFSNFVQKLLV